jgi:hypothetical protein
MRREGVAHARSAREECENCGAPLHYLGQASIPPTPDVPSRSPFVAECPIECNANRCLSYLTAKRPPV